MQEREREQQQQEEEEEEEDDDDDDEALSLANAVSHPPPRRLQRLQQFNDYDEVLSRRSALCRAMALSRLMRVWLGSLATAWATATKRRTPEQR